MPHLNKLQSTFGKKGLTVIGVTDESKGKVQPYVDKNGIDYLIALGGGAGYKTRGIPHSWVVGPKGDVVWKGHPGSLTDAIIEEHIRGVRLTPVFELPKALSSAEKRLNAGKYASGIKSLEKYLSKPKDDAVAAEATKAITQVKTYGDEKYREAESYAAEGYYADAMLILAMLEKSFKDMEVGTKAKEKRQSWKKDKSVKAELEACALYDQAADLSRQKKFLAAYKLLQKVVGSKKYEGTKARERANDKLKEIQQNI